MSLLNKPKLTPPNEQGFQFGIDDSLTEYAQKSQFNGGNELPAIPYHVLQVWKDDKLVSRLIVDDNTNEPVADMPGFEAIAARLDVMKLATKMKPKKQ